MENTSPKKLRAKLKDYLDLAKKEVIRIKRRSGQNYILVSEEKYNDLKAELHALQKRLLGKSHVVEKVKEKIKGKKGKKGKTELKTKGPVKTKKSIVKKATKKIAKTKA